MKASPEHPLFTREMKGTHTILIPTMLPVHFAFMEQIFKLYGYNCKVLSNSGSQVIEEGLKYVHNDTCYPALIVIGQLIDAVKSGEYDTDKIAFMITQTGGGCRASNYIFLLRKALKKSGLGHIPVISLNFSGLDSAPGFKLSLGLIRRLVYAVVLGDFITCIANQCRPYEVNPGDTDRVVDKWRSFFISQWRKSRLSGYKNILCEYGNILDDFAKIPKQGEAKPRVGIVGEIYVKYSPMGNNNLEEFLLSEGAEPVVPGLMDFCMYCCYNGTVNRNLYGGGALAAKATKLAYNFFLKKQHDMIDAIKRHGVFHAPTPFEKTCAMAGDYINQGVKMGEGWLLTAEMAELISDGVNNIICTQPFGCLPNHIAGKGMINKLKEKHPDANIVAIDYDPGASRVNQQNRIKMMLSNATTVDSSNNKIPIEQK